ncbi:P-loop containing nucleoside triphosphate hydrolase protein [Myriangium duriaei CBS 260.36]|uniref:RNA helicase n=1 Tax=Myriangium duriaei CBS 260.36 TaxID=1168546 RepID=A0A9P4MGH3_9PEZI|nr:P-loop containing nucleoside triphosphate hydrolase protein [Myriangium duriaei CBS 260.36]
MQPLRHSNGICLFCRHLPSQSKSLYTFKRFKDAQIGSYHSSKSKPRQNSFTARRHDTGRTPTHDSHGIRRNSPSGRKDQSISSGSVPRHILHDAINQAQSELQNAPIVEYLEKEGRSLNSTFADFRPTIKDRSDSGSDANRFSASLATEFTNKGYDGLVARIKYGFYGFVSGLRFTKEELANQQALADLRYPAEWWASTRRLQRTVHLHVGPTNSGKTYHALRSLEAAGTGMYAGPLRLLAHEVYSRMNAKGRRCALITGEERRAPEKPDGTPDFSIASCTVEMLSMNRIVDVCVIDEIQMLGDPDRGWAWTQALLGVQAHELHLCGETRTVPLVQELCAIAGDKLIIHNYERLSPLKMDKQSLNGDFTKLRKGDCIVSFSVMGIHALRKVIEEQTGKKVAIVYGGLPPETRAQQARLFNDPDNDYDFLVASDAIGMGLNLSVKRIIFETTVKFNGLADSVIETAHIKQIAGRAGRYKTARDDTPKLDLKTAIPEGESVEHAESQHATRPVTDFIVPPTPFSRPSAYEQAMKSAGPPPKPSTDDSSVGLVTTLQHSDFPIVKAALEQDPPPIKTSGIFPPANIVERFAQYFPPGTPFSYVLLRLNEISQLNNRFHICGLRDALYIADLIEPVRGLSIPDRMIFANAPISFSDRKNFAELVPELAEAVVNQSGGALYEIQNIPLELLEQEVTMERGYLRSLETLHKAIVLYLWLSFRFFGIFSTRQLATELKTRIEERIEVVLEGLSTESKRQSIIARREKKRFLDGVQPTQPEDAASGPAIEEELEDGFDRLAVSTST